jgi:hypothetical protein
MLKKYREYYSSYFENIKGDSIVFLDDETSGIITTKEYYTINDFWKLKDGVNKASLQPFLIDEVLKKPEERQRSAPYLLNFPVDYKEEIEINLPEEWEVDEWSDVIKNESTEFKYNYSCSGSRILLKYEYRSLKDFIAANEIDNYLADYKKINSNAGFSLTYGEKTISHVKGVSTTGGSKDIFPALYILLIIAVLITIAIRKNKSRNSF